ncbi:uncharacterized protein RSE6_00286 [Rhynchosporium secalis]|uniref:Uncharacterized protein n=1 Tax=Rhynchosporium secalis TaxID=38038 RepID=A0A1E1LUU4_RHYSE|nr:uncharacterized protein RSE6_00286 [Rhynchosporium secalis]
MTKIAVSNFRGISTKEAYIKTADTRKASTREAPTNEAPYRKCLSTNEILRR